MSKSGKKVVAMLLAGGQGSRLGVLTNNKAKPGVAFGGKYRIIDFPMSNCINSGVDTVGVLTQYAPLSLNKHIGIGIPWDLDRENGGVTILAPHVKGDDFGKWYTGTANAIYQNLEYLESYEPEYVIVLSGDHIYKMDYSKMLDFHISKGADATIAVLEVTLEEASRFGIMNADENYKIYEFEEKPEHPKSNLASMGIYIFNWDEMRARLITDNRVHMDSDFGKHIIPDMLENGKNLYAYKFDGYWKDVGTIESYWSANMELIKTVPEFNLYEDFWKIYTNSEKQIPLYISETGTVKSSLVAGACHISGTAINSVIGSEVVLEEGALVENSIIMTKCVIKKNAKIDRCIIDERCIIEENCVLGTGENVPNFLKPNIYDTGITVIAENTVVPANVTVGRNCVIVGTTVYEDYDNGRLESGGSIIIDKEEVL